MFDIYNVKERITLSIHTHSHTGMHIHTGTFSKGEHLAWYIVDTVRLLLKSESCNVTVKLCRSHFRVNSYRALITSLSFRNLIVISCF